MELQGEYLFAAPRPLVWQAVRDPHVLGSILPGGEAITEVGENQYQGKMRIKVGPVQGKFSGNIGLTEIVELVGYTFSLEGKGTPGLISASGHLQLVEQDQQKTSLHYTGEAQLGGKIATVGQRLTEAAAKSLIKQTLEALDLYLQTQMAAQLEVCAEQLPVAEPLESAEPSSPVAMMATQLELSAEQLPVAEPLESAEPSKKEDLPPPAPSYTPPTSSEMSYRLFREIFLDLVPPSQRPYLLWGTGLLCGFLIGLSVRRR